MESKGLSDVKFSPAEGYDALYFQRLFARPDTLPDLEKDDDYELLRKKELQFSRMTQIAKGIKEPWFRYLEEVLVGRLDEIDALIWGAIREQNEKAIFKLSMEHHGIIAFFNLYKNLSQGISSLADEIEDLTRKLETPTVSDDPNADGHINL
ncbi:MAG: hypothetical protein C4570_02065 [Ammonifex sp.]|jgi:hypothetical protein|nr:MAG: hypothetical protein C4570_02065 [Ammonifex sp.]